MIKTISILSIYLIATYLTSFSLSNNNVKVLNGTADSIIALDGYYIFIYEQKRISYSNDVDKATDITIFFSPILPSFVLKDSSLKNLDTLPNVYIASRLATCLCDDEVGDYLQDYYTNHKEDSILLKQLMWQNDNKLLVEFRRLKEASENSNKTVIIMEGKMSVMKIHDLNMNAKTSVKYIAFNGKDDFLKTLGVFFF